MMRRIVLTSARLRLKKPEFTELWGSLAPVTAVYEAAHGNLSTVLSCMDLLVRYLPPGARSARSSGDSVVQFANTSSTDELIQLFTRAIMAPDPDYTPPADDRPEATKTAPGVNIDPLAPRG